MTDREYSLYGVAVELSDGWRDGTEYVFQSHSALRKVSFQMEDVPGRSSERWLAEMRNRLRELGSQVHVGAVHPYVRSRAPAPARGFEVRYGDDIATSEHQAVVVIPMEERCLVIRAAGVKGFQEPLGHIVFSLGEENGRPLLPGWYPVFALAFHSPISWQYPEEFEFANRALRARLSFGYVTPRPPFASPDWSARFGLAPEAVFSGETQHKEPATGRGGLLVLATSHASVRASSKDGVRDLFFAEAFVSSKRGEFHLSFECEQDRPVALAEWRHLVASVRVEA